MVLGLAKWMWPAGLMLGAGAAMAASLPLKPGTFVMAGASCHDPALAAVFSYDGRAFSYPHATKCRSVIRAHRGAIYRVEETCAAAGDGSPAPSPMIATTYRVLSRTRVVVSHGSADAGVAYRWCPSPW